MRLFINVTFCKEGCEFLPGIVRNRVKIAIAILHPSPLGGCPGFGLSPGLLSEDSNLSDRKGMHASLIIYPVKGARGMGD